MGTDVGIAVKRQDDGYRSTGRNPKGTTEEIAASVGAYIEARVPGCSGKLDVLLNDGWYYFVAEQSGPDGPKCHKAMVDWAWENFGTMDGFELRAWWAP